MEAVVDAKSVRALSKDNVHLICSAQVILSPANVLKELIENSLDAGATKIDVKLVNNGLTSISVSDNGSGVKEEDFEGLTAKHHTSKLKQFDDLDYVDTFGFRGEALSSLCAVGNLTIRTRHKSQDLGFHMVFDHDGRIVSKKRESRPPGTSVTLENIFCSLPVRQKELQRNAKRELAKSIHILQSYGLAAPAVRMNCSAYRKSNGQPETAMLTTGSGSVKSAAVEIFGSKQAANLLDFATESVQGFISSCQHGQGRSRPDRQFFFVNNRPCDSRLGAKSVNEIYHQFNRHQFPFVIAFVGVNGHGSVDVNLTPDKRKIFLEKEAQIWDGLKPALNEIFEKVAPPDISIINTAPLSNRRREPEESPSLSKLRQFRLPSAPDSIRFVEPKCKKPKSNPTPRKLASFGFTTTTSSSKIVGPAERHDNVVVVGENGDSGVSKFKLTFVDTDNKRVGREGGNPQDIITDEEVVLYDEPTTRRARRREVSVAFSMAKAEEFCKRATSLTGRGGEEPKGRRFLASIGDNAVAETELKRHLAKEDFRRGRHAVVGQFNLGFIIARLLDDDIFIIDQHASDEKYRFERLVQDAKMSSQPLVNSQDLELDVGRQELLRDNLAALEMLGFKFETTGSDRIRLSAVPRCDRLTLGREDLDEVLYLLSEEANFRVGSHQFSRLRLLFASRACRTAVMIGTALTRKKMSEIVNNMADMDQPWNCPHGRPTLRHLVNLKMIDM